MTIFIDQTTNESSISVKEITLSVLTVMTACVAILIIYFMIRIVMTSCKVSACH